MIKLEKIQIDYYIYINPKHEAAPPAALAALLAHEALHQDEYNSLSEEEKEKWRGRSKGGICGIYVYKEILPRNV